MPTIVHTMLVRVASMVCWEMVGSASAGAAVSGSVRLGLSAGAWSGSRAAGPFALMVAPVLFPRMVAHSTGYHAYQTASFR
jgi:hypothetical protein